MSYIEIYDKVRTNWESESGTQSSSSSSSTPDLHLKSVKPSADAARLFFTVGAEGNSTYDKTIEMNFGGPVAKLVGATVTPYDDRALKKRLTALEAKKPSDSGANPFKEYEAKYIPRSEFGSLENNTFAPVTFSKTFSKIPFVVVTLDLRTTTPRVAYVGNITTAGFQFAANYAPDIKGLWYQAYILE